MSKGAEVHEEIFFFFNTCPSFFIHKNLKLNEKQQFGDE